MENTANFPLTYCLFLGTCFLLWKPKYISLIKISRWVPNSLQKIILELFTLIYSNIIWIVFLLISCILIIYLLSKYTSFFYILLPKKKLHEDDSTILWSEYFAVIRLFSILGRLITQFFIYYFTLNVLFNPYNFVNNFFIGETVSAKNALIIKGYLPADALVTLNIFFAINVLITVWFLLRAFFETKTTTDTYYLSSDDLILYTKINSFPFRKGTEILILKKNYGKKPEFLLVSKETFDDGKGYYHVLDIADKLPDIVYHFEALKEETIQNNSST